MSPFTGWYERVYPELSGYGLWLRGGEINTLPPEEFDRRPLRVLITRLSTYGDTAESFTHKLLYQFLKNIPGVFPDMAFLPPPNDAKIMDRDKAPWLIGAQTKRPPGDFDIIAFSNSIAEELANVPVMLEKSKIPLEKTKRLADPSMPLVILGGANALYTSVFWISDAPVDGIFVGESAECIKRIFEIARDAKSEGKSKSAILDALGNVPGFFQPDKIKKTRKFHSAALSDEILLDDAPVLYAPEQIGRGNLQISEGCPCFCSFCCESYVRKPYREVPLQALFSHALRMKAAMGADRCELYSFNFNMYGDFYPLVSGLAGTFDAIGLKSQRFDSLGRDPNMPALLHAINKTSLTCGLEGISGRLRRYLHKNLSDADLIKSFSVIFKSPVRELKIFLIATGLEGKNDYAELEELLKILTDNISASGSRPRVIFSITPLVRFPWTPLEFESAFDVEHYKSIISKIASMVRRHGFEFRQSADMRDWRLSQILVRASDERIYRALLQAIRGTGFVYYREIPASFANEFEKQVIDNGLNISSLLSGFSIDESNVKPWTNIETGVSRNFLIRQNELCRMFEENDYCLGNEEKEGACLDCGACEDSSGVKAITRRRPKQSTVIQRIRDKISDIKKNEKAVNFLVDVGEPGRGLPRKYMGVAIARALMAADSSITRGYRRYERSFWEKRSSNSWIEGDDIITMIFCGETAEKISRLLCNQIFVGSVNRHLGKWGRLKDIAARVPEKIRIAVFSPYGFDGGAYLKSLKLKYVLRKTGDDAYRCDFTKEAEKKKILYGLSVEKNAAGGCALEISAGIKFNPEDFAKEAFVLPDRRDWVRIRMRARCNTQPYNDSIVRNIKPVGNANARRDAQIGRPYGTTEI